MIVGSQVNTSLGAGEIVGIEFPDSHIKRYLVRLNDKSQWSLGDRTDIAAFFPEELDHFRDPTKMVYDG